jgi:hypothetical protein
MTKGITKTIATLLTVATISGATLSTASASDRGFEVKPVKQHSRKGAIAGAILGIGGALIGAAIVHSQARAERRDHDDEPRRHGYGRQRAVAFVEADEDCFERPVRRFDRYSGETVTVGYKTVCR